MASSPFHARTPSLLPSPSRSQEQPPPPPLIAQDLVGVTWNMIASSSSMWLDRKYSITINYSANDASKLTEVTAWYSDHSNQQSSTRGISSPLATGLGYVYDWRGAGWLRLITTRWEIIGLGELSYPDGVGESNAVAMVTFVQKTIFSPAALSVLILQSGGQVHDTQKENIVKAVVMALTALGAESLDGEIDKLKAIP